SQGLGQRNGSRQTHCRRTSKVAALIIVIDSAMGKQTGAPNIDDKKGLGELRFSADELRRAEAGEAVRTTININGDGGRYELSFEARNTGWQGFELAPANSASVNGSVAAVSRVPGSMELWYVGGNGSVQDRF